VKGDGTLEDNKHKKKMIAPIAITVIFVAYLLIYFIFILLATEFNPWMAFSAIPLIALGIGMVYTLKSRIKEIRSGEEDDLSNY